MTNVIDTVTCDYNPDGPCPSKCATVVGEGVSITQYTMLLDPPNCPCAGSPVIMHDVACQYYGCTTCTNKPYQSACDISYCSGEIWEIYTGGEWRACGFSGSCP
jgi:hypothetical protein